MSFIVVTMIDGSSASDMGDKVDSCGLCGPVCCLPNLVIGLRNRSILLFTMAPRNMSRRGTKPPASPFIPPPTKTKDINLIDNADELLDLLQRTNERLTRYALATLSPCSTASSHPRFSWASDARQQYERRLRSDAAK